jgi:hypothetical protein
MAAKHTEFKDSSYYSDSSALNFHMKIKYIAHVKMQVFWDMTLSSWANISW